MLIKNYCIISKSTDIHC